MSEEQKLTLNDIWELLSEHGDITITVAKDAVPAIRRGMAKRRHTEAKQLGEYADKTLTFNSTVIAQTPEEKEAGLCRLRLTLSHKREIAVMGVQINDGEF